MFYRLSSEALVMRFNRFSLALVPWWRQRFRG